MNNAQRLLALFLLLASTSAEGQVTAFKTGEEQTGLTKQCYYAFGSTRYTRTISSVALCPLSITVPTAGPAATGGQLSTPSTGLTAFKSGEETTGLTKQCYYSFGTTRYTKTVRSFDLCPLSITVKQW